MLTASGQRVLRGKPDRLQVRVRVADDDEYALLLNVAQQIGK